MIRPAVGQFSRVLGLALLLIGAANLRGEAQRPELIYYRFNVGAGTTSNNFAVPGPPGGLVVPAVLGPAGSWTLTGSTIPALGSRCLALSGAQGAIACQTNVPFNHVGDWTMDFWIQRTANLGPPFNPTPDVFPATILGGSSPGDLEFGILPLPVDAGFALSRNNVNVIRFGYLTLGQWTHVAIVHNVSEKRISAYVDGMLTATRAISTPIPIGSTATSGMVFRSFGGYAGNPLIDEFRIWKRALRRAEILSYKNAQINLHPMDLAVVAITAPLDPKPSTFVPFSSTETVTARIENCGSTPLSVGTLIPLTLAHNGTVIANETLVVPATVTTGQSLSFTFSTTVDMSAAMAHRLKVTVSWPGDGQPVNDTRVRIYGGSDDSHYVMDFPYQEDFSDLFPMGGNVSSEGIPCGWSGTTTTYPVSTSQGIGAAVVFEAPSGAILESPLLDLRGISNPRVEITTQIAGFTFGWLNTIRMDVVEWPAGAVTTGVLPDTVSSFFPVTDAVNLTPFSGSVVTLRFVSSVQMGTAPPITMRKVEIRDHPSGSGQVPQPGIAVFDLNNSINSANDPVSYGGGGPFFATTLPGSLLQFSFEGEANKPVILIHGPLNPGAATFGSVGQMDIGGLPDPISGIPVNTAVIFDGTLSSGLNPFFRTNNSGIVHLQLLTPMLSPGILTTFQAAIFNSSLGIALSNAIRLEVQ